MASTISPLLRLELMTTGEKTNTWGPIADRNFGTLMEQAVAGVAAVSVTAANLTLTTQDGQADEARCMILLVSGTPGTSRNIVAPSTSKLYVVINGSDGAVVVKGAATTGISIAAGDLAWVGWNGADFVRVTPSPIAPTFSGTVTAAGFVGPLTGHASLDLPLTGGTLSGALTDASGFIGPLTGHASLDLPLTGGTLSGALVAPSGVTLAGGYEAGFLKLPIDAAGASITTAQRGMCVQATTTIGIPNATFAAGDAVTIFNTTASPITLTATVTTLRLAGTATTGNRTLAGYGICTVVFISGTLAVVSGSGVT